MEKTACPKCGWETDATKAFCPDCGEPLVVEQKREQSSEFVEAGQTKQFSASVFNLILNADDKLEPVPEDQPAPAPPPPAAAPPVISARPQPSQPSIKVRAGGVSSLKPLGAPKSEVPSSTGPAAAPAPPEPQPSSAPAGAAPAKGRSWLKILLVLAAVFVVLLLLIVAVGGFLAWRFLDLKLPI